MKQRRRSCSHIAKPSKQKKNLAFNVTVPVLNPVEVNTIAWSSTTYCFLELFNQAMQ